MQLTKNRRTRCRDVVIGVGVAVAMGGALMTAPAAQANPPDPPGAGFYSTLDLERPELSDVAAAVDESNYAAANEELAAFYAARESPTYLPVVGDPDAIPAAMDISEGRFEWAGGQVRDYYDPETDRIDVDWDDPWEEYENPPISAPASMNRFLFNNDLTSAYEALPTDDPRRAELAEAWMEISLDFIADKGDVPIGAPPHNRLTEGIRLTNWLEAFSIFKDAPGVSAADKITYLGYVRDMAEEIARNIDRHDGNNWFISLGRALYLTAIYLPEFTDADSWRFKSVAVADRYVSRNMRSDGLSYEPAIHYQNYSLRLLSMMQRFGTLNGDTPFSDQELSFLERQTEAIAAVTMPNFTIPLFGDSTDATLDMSGVETFAEELGRDDLTWVATEGAAGTEPAGESTLFPQSYAVMRGGWDPDDQYLFIGNQDTAYAASHRHPDDLSMVAYAYGRPLVVDPGAYDYSDSESANWMRRTTEAHNTVEVGGEPQPPSTPDDPSARSSLRWYSNDGFDFYTGSHEDYDPISHERSVFSPKPGFWIVSDVLAGSAGSEDYRQLWHFPADADVNVESETETVNAGFGEVPGVAVSPVDPGTTSTTVHDDGYLTDGYDNLHSGVEYVSFDQSASGDASFDTVLYPGDAGNAPSIDTRRVDLDVPRDTATGIELDLPDGNDGIYYLTHEASPTARSVDGYEFDGRLFYVEKDDTGELNRFSLAGGGELVDDATRLVTSTETINDLSVEYDDATAVLSTGEPLSGNLTVHAPGVTDVVLNGSSVPFTADGDAVTISAPSLVPSDPPLLDETFEGPHDGLERTWDFEEGQAGGWQGLPGQGQWSVSDLDGNTVYQQTDRHQIEGMAILEESVTDVAVEATVERGLVGSSHYGFGLALRMQDAGTYYMARLYHTPDGVSAELLKAAGGDATHLARVPLSIDPAGPHALRASISGDALKFWVNGELVATAVDDGLEARGGIPNGGVGLQAHRATASFDDIRVEEPTDTTTWSASRGTFVDTDEGLTMQASGVNRSLLGMAQTVSWEDYVADATFLPEEWSDSSELGLAVRSTKGTLGYRAVLVNDGDEQFARIERHNAGSHATSEPTVIAETPVSFPTDEPLPVRVVARGSTIELWLDDEMLTSATDTVIGQGGVSIIGSDVTATVTDVTVRELAPVHAELSVPVNHPRPGRSVPVFVELDGPDPESEAGTPDLVLQVTAPDGTVSDVPLRGSPHGRLTGIVRTESDLPGNYRVQLLWSGLPVQVADFQLGVGTT